MEILGWTFVVVMMLAFVVVLIGAGKTVWDECPSFAEFVKGLGAPVSGHKMVDREKEPLGGSSVKYKYSWTCECGVFDYEYGMLEAYKAFLQHRRTARSRVLREKWEAKEKTAKKGWL